MTERDDNEPLRISVEVAKARADAGNGTIVDVDDHDNFSHRDRKLPGAIRIDPRDISDDNEKLTADRAILAYCTCPNEETSASVALFLRKQGFEAYAIEGGLDAWREAEYPLEMMEG